MALSITDLLNAAIPASFKQLLYDKVEARGLVTTAWEPGDPTRTILAGVSQVMAIAFGTASTKELVDAATKAGRVLVDPVGIVQNYAHGAFLKFASLVTPDPSVALSDGTYPKPGMGFLDVDADAWFNVQRTGSVAGNGGPAVTSNAALVAQCVAKVTPLGPLFTVPPAGFLLSTDLDPHVYFALDPSASPVAGAYAGAALSAPCTRANVVISPGLVQLYLANAAGVMSAADVQKEHDFLQQTTVPTSITLIVFAASGVNVAPSMDVYVPTKNQSQATGDVQAAVTAYLSSVPVGGLPGVGALKGVPRERLIASVFEQVPYVQDIENCTLMGAASDVIMSASQVPLPLPAIVVNVKPTG